MSSYSSKALIIFQKAFEQIIYFILYYVVLFSVSLGEFIHLVVFNSLISLFGFLKQSIYIFICIFIPAFFIWLKQKVSAFMYVVGIILVNTPHYILVTLRYIIGLIIASFFNIISISISFWKFIQSRFFVFFMYGFLTCLMVVVLFQIYMTIVRLPSPRYIGEINFAQSTHLYDRNGKLLFEIYKDVNRTPVSLEAVPSHLIHATIAIEDKHFYTHNGISLIGGVLRALKDTVKTKELQGGSTITQQLVKTALLTQDRTIERKIKEMIIALWAEQMYTKDEILEMYLNQVAYGGESYGVQQAAEIYFGKPVSQLQLHEAALLAGLPRAPSIYSPYVDPELALQRRNQVLYEMKQEGYIRSDEYKTASQKPLGVIAPQNNIRAPHFVMYTRALLERDYGIQQVQEAGFRVQTTLDYQIQKQAEIILQEEIAKLYLHNVSNGGIIVMNPHTGEILAMVGSVDYFQEPYGAYNVTTALRQPGSTLKPMLYAMALENGFTAASAIDDSPIVFATAGSEPYRPVNYDGRFHGRISIRHALANSYNIPAVKVLNTLGVEPFVMYAKRMGIDTWEDSSRFGLSLSLGGGEVTLIDLAQVFSVFANGGYRVEPSTVRSITDYREQIVEEFSPEKVPVIDAGIAFIISDILSDNQARIPAFGPNNSLHIPNYRVSAKTGTTNDYKDAWAVGYTSDVVVGVWVGNNDNTPMIELPGSLGAAPIFNRMMTYLLEEYDMKGEVIIPSNIVAQPCYAGKNEYFIRGTEQDSYCYKTVFKPSELTPKQP